MNREPIIPSLLNMELRQKESIQGSVGFNHELKEMVASRDTADKGLFSSVESHAGNWTVEMFSEEQ